MREGSEGGAAAGGVGWGGGGFRIREGRYEERCGGDCGCDERDGDTLRRAEVAEGADETDTAVLCGVVPVQHQEEVSIMYRSELRNREPQSGAQPTPQSRTSFAELRNSHWQSRLTSIPCHASSNHNCSLLLLLPDAPPANPHSISHRLQIDPQRRMIRLLLNVIRLGFSTKELALLADSGVGVDDVGVGAEVGFGESEEGQQRRVGEDVGLVVDDVRGQLDGRRGEISNDYVAAQRGELQGGGEPDSWCREVSDAPGAAVGQRGDVPELPPVMTAVRPLKEGCEVLMALIVGRGRSQSCKSRTGRAEQLHLGKR